MSKKNKQEINLVLHQHIDKQGKVCGAKHPINLNHRNQKTQKRHDFTIKK